MVCTLFQPASRDGIPSGTVLVIDVFNVLHCGGILPPELVLHELSDLAWLLENSRYAGSPRVLVCDGVRPGVGHTGPSTTRIGEARVIYAGAGREADYEIEGIIERSSFPTRLLVVSSDKRIAKAARKRHAPYLKSEGFLRQLALDADRRHAEPMPKWVHEIPLPRSSVEHWLETFGIDTQDQSTGSASARTTSERTNPDRISTEPDLISRGLEAMEALDRPEPKTAAKPTEPEVPLPKLTLGEHNPPPAKSTPASTDSKADSKKARPKIAKNDKSRGPQRPSLPDAEELRRLALEQGIDLDAIANDPDLER